MEGGELKGQEQAQGGGEVAGEARQQSGSDLTAGSDVSEVAAAVGS